MAKRRSHTPEFKAALVLQALRGEFSVARLAALNNVTPAMLHKWIREAKDGLPGLFACNKSVRNNRMYEAQIRQLHEKIGRLTMERDLLAGACGAGPQKGDSLKKIKIMP